MTPLSGSGGTGQSGASATGSTSVKPPQPDFTTGSEIERAARAGYNVVGPAPIDPSSGSYITKGVLTAKADSGVVYQLAPVTVSAGRWVDVTAWHHLFKPFQIGHVMMTVAGTHYVLGSQFPQKATDPGHHVRGPNTRHSFTETYADEKGIPQIARVWVPDGASFDAKVLEEINRSTWTCIPLGSSSTQCSTFVYDSLKAGRVPVFGHSWGTFMPDAFMDMMTSIAHSPKSGVSILQKAK